MRYIKQVIKGGILAVSLLTATSPCSAVLIKPIDGASVGEFFEWHISDVVRLGGPEDLVGFTLQFVSHEIFIPDAFSATRSGFRGITGEFHQEQLATPSGLVVPSPDLITSGGSRFDTHFLIRPDEVIGIDGIFFEDPIDDTTSREPGEFPDTTATGFGDTLKGTFAFTGVRSELMWDFVYLVTRPGSVVSLHAEVAGLNPGGHPTVAEESFEFTFVAPTGIPEPGSVVLCMIAIGTICLSNSRTARC